MLAFIGAICTLIPFCIVATIVLGVVSDNLAFNRSLRDAQHEREERERLLAEQPVVDHVDHRALFEAITRRGGEGQ